MYTRNVYLLKNLPVYRITVLKGITVETTLYFSTEFYSECKNLYRDHLYKTRKNSNFVAEWNHPVNFSQCVVLKIADSKPTSNKPPQTVQNTPKKSLWEKIKEEGKHYWHASKLLWLNIKVSNKLFKRTLKGQKLTRREQNLLSRTVGDLFKLVPFSAFVLVPFLEFTLPFFLIFFPGMLPSPYETKSQKENKIKRKFNLQLEMAKFLQNTLISMTTKGLPGRVSQEANEFSNFFERVRLSKEPVSAEEVMKYCQLFRDDITLNSLDRPQVKALCKILGIRTLGTSTYLRYQVELKLRKLRIDDKLIYAEGINNLNPDEVEAACLARGIPVLGSSPEKMRHHLAQWLELSVERDVPPSLLLISQAFMFPSDIPTKDALARTITELPEDVINTTKADLQIACGRIDYEAECECIRKEYEKVEEERKECPCEDGSQNKGNETNEIECALCSILNKKMRLQKDKLFKLKQRMNKFEQAEMSSSETKATKQLKNKLKRMIINLSSTLSKLENKPNGQEEQSCEYIQVQECAEILESLTDVCQSTKEKVMKICHRLDRDDQGRVTTETLVKVTEIIKHLEETLTSEQVEDIIDLIDKEGMVDLQSLKSVRQGDSAGYLKEKLHTKKET